MASKAKPEHIPVLLNECLELLAIKQDGTYIDGTLGLGGHSAAILERLGPEGRLIGIDRDDRALELAGERLGADSRFRSLKGPFAEMAELAGSIGVEAVDGVLLDLGVSMMQLRELERGFSFMSDARLDMRMDPVQELSAWEVINRYPEKELLRILYEYGEESLSRKIVKRILERRHTAPVNTCAELADLVLQAYGGRGKTHPATRTFQAVRIEVNAELEQLKRGLEAAVGLMKPGGRVVVISYHSLEDRIVKNVFRDLGREKVLQVLTKKPIAPERAETLKNPASRSAKLRGVEKI